MDADEALRLDYEQTTQLMRTLTDVRFKLLAFVPTISGAAVAFMGAHRTAGELLAVGLLGLAATSGVLLYELRNSELYGTIVARAAGLEQKLGLGLFGGIDGRNEHGFGLVYGAALAGWAYLVVWGALHVLGLAHARSVGALVGALVGVAVAIRVERRTATSAS